MAKNLPYDAKQFHEKEAWIESVITEYRPHRVLDIGCNTGHFSRLAARQGCSVVAVDSDPSVIDESYQLAKKEGLNVLPLVIDISSPSPAVGWRNLETTSFLDRATGHFDLVLMLAVIHHLNLKERLPVKEVLAIAAQLTRGLLIIEFVGGDDVSVKDLASQMQVSEVLNQHQFESTARLYFDIVRQHQVSGSDRVLYLLRKKRALG